MNNKPKKQTSNLSRTTEKPKKLNRTADTAHPTKEAYSELQKAYDFLRTELFKPIFDVILPDVMFNLPITNRYSGCFIPNIWGKESDVESKSSAISLILVGQQSDEEILSTLAHEMVHLGQEVFPEAFGKPCKGGYHGKGFLKSMVLIGLMPSSTGKPGGKTTGYSMSDYVLTGSPIETLFKQFKERGYEFSWCVQLQTNNGNAEGYLDKNGNPIDKNKERKRRSKTKYTCDNCQLNAWAKPSVLLNCGECDVQMIEAIESNNFTISSGEKS